jgi:hypothetical protein
MADSTLATAADYADAMLTARRAKNWLFRLLLLILLIQLAAFFLYHFDWLKLTAPSHATTAPAPAPVRTAQYQDLLRFLTALCDFLGIALVIVLALVLFLIAIMMLVGRLIGVSRITSAYVWSLVLAVLLFPWQALLESYAFPGVLYTWTELVTGARWPADAELEILFLRWARFVGFPVVAVIILLSIQITSSRGLRQALGESPPPPPAGL